MIDLKEQYGKRYKVSVCEEGEGGCYEIVGKSGCIRAYGDELEMYLMRPVIEKRLERSQGAFKIKNHYDDATSFTFRNDPLLVSAACKFIKARNRKQYTPEQRVAMAARMQSLRLKSKQQASLADELS